MHWNIWFSYMVFSIQNSLKWYERRKKSTVSNTIEGYIELWLVLSCHQARENKCHFFSSFLSVDLHKTIIFGWKFYFDLPKKWIIFKISHQRTKHVIRFTFCICLANLTQINLYIFLRHTNSIRREKSKMEFYQKICSKIHRPKFFFFFTFFKYKFLMFHYDNFTNLLCRLIQRTVYFRFVTRK